MPLYVEIDYDSVTYRVSTEDVADTHFWDGIIVDMSTPQYATESDLGGFCRMAFGSIGLSVMWFDEIAVWPPPKHMDARIYYSHGTESEKRLCWSASLHRKQINDKAVTYDVYDPVFDTQLLTEAENYSGDTVPLPMAIGTVSYMPAERLPDDIITSRQRYCLADIQGTAGVDWHVFDDGIDVCANVGAVASNVFELTVAAVGEISLSGSGSVTTLAGLFAWACDATRLNLTLNDNYSTAQAISWEATGQGLLIDFLSDVAVACNHLFYVIDTILMLCDLDLSPPGIATVLLDMDGDGLEDETGDAILADNDTVDVDTGDYLTDTSITDLSPRSSARCAWITRQAVTETIGAYVKESDQELVVESDYPYGDEMNMDVYSATRTTISDRLTAALSRLHMPRVKLSLPMVSLTMLPAPGQRVIAADDRTPRDLVADIHARSIAFDFIGMRVTIQGEGSIA